MNKISKAERDAILDDPATPHRIAALFRVVVQLAREDRAAGDRARACRRLELARRLRALATFCSSRPVGTRTD